MLAKRTIKTLDSKPEQVAFDGAFSSRDKLDQLIGSSVEKHYTMPPWNSPLAVASCCIRMIASSAPLKGGCLVEHRGGRRLRIADAQRRRLVAKRNGACLEGYMHFDVVAP